MSDANDSNDPNTIKQFLLLSGKPILIHTLNVFYSFDTGIELILVLPETYIVEWQKICDAHQFKVPHAVTTGGETRFHSVKNGLKLVNEEGVIAVHDGVRCLVSQETIQNTYEKAEEIGNAVPVIPVNESIRRTDGLENTSTLRSNYKLVQTPQCFRSEILKRAYLQDFDEAFTDDASVVEKGGEKINLVDGNRENIKITTPADLIIAEALMNLS